MRIYITSVFVDDQEKALAFYRDVLGFAPKHDIPMGEDRWLTVTSSEAPEGPQLLLEPSGHPAVPPFKQALVRDGIPAASFAVDDVQAEYERLQERGVLFTQAPVTMGEVTMAVFDDTCGNLVQIVAGG
ncbi:MAG: VOC family protein [Trueperaceae bacterium]|nr:VOC family protein [Trueperaceae bacterium]